MFLVCDIHLSQFATLLFCNKTTSLVSSLHALWCKHYKKLHCNTMRMYVLRALSNEHDLLLEMAHDPILANILADIYNTLMSYLVLLTFEHDLRACRLHQNTITWCQKVLHRIEQGVRFRESEVENTIYIEKYI